MAHRTFVDNAGTRWEVWEVRPQWADRRSGVDRRQLGLDDPRADPPVFESRSGVERRTGDGKRVPRVKMGDSFSGGWLAFESLAERRRLSPIPPGWDQADESNLATLCARATVVTTRRGRLIE